MSMGVEHGGKGYAPLPQSMSNTDTENEDYDVDSQDYNPEKRCHQSMKHDSTVIQENGRFYPLDETKTLASRLRNGRNNVNLSLGYCSDDIPIMVVDQDANNDLWKRPHMSFVRQLFLAASVLLCIATILIFLYVLPCNDDDLPSTDIKNRPALLWDNTLHGIELLGPISVVPGPPYNLIFMFRGQLYGDEGGQTEGPSGVPPRGGGVISMHGGNGLLLWWAPLRYTPTEIDCDNLDVDGSGKPDCLVAGEEGLLVSISQQTGIPQWTSAAKTHSKLPVFLPDIDNDGIDDLLTVQITNGGTLGLALISGRNGCLLGHHLRPDCHRIHIYSVDLSATVTYLCHDSNGKQSMKTISLTELYKGMNLPQVEKQLSAKQKDLSNPYIIPEKNLDEEILSLTPYHQLAVHRRGSCPGDLCQTTMNVTFQSKMSNDSHSIWSSSGSNAYGMEPVSLTDIKKPLVTGFVMKFWQWNIPASNQLDKINSSVTRRSVTEWTSVVIINQTEVHPVNASQTDITQICSETECQPSLKLQSQSLLISDLNHDGYRELISYQTSYEMEREVFLLKSRVQVVRLDVEVAKLTQTVIV